MEQLVVKQNDHGYDLFFEVVNYDNTALDLTVANAISLNLKLANSTDAATVLAATVADAANGICKYNVQNGTFAADGIYIAELQVTFSSGEVITVPTFQIIVESEIV